MGIMKKSYIDIALQLFIIIIYCDDYNEGDSNRDDNNNNNYEDNVKGGLNAF